MKLTARFLVAMLAAVVRILGVDAALRIRLAEAALGSGTWRAHGFAGRTVRAMYEAHAVA